MKTLTKYFLQPLKLSKIIKQKSYSRLLGFTQKASFNLNRKRFERNALVFYEHCFQRWLLSLQIAKYSFSNYDRQYLNLL